MKHPNPEIARLLTGTPYGWPCVRTDRLQARVSRYVPVPPHPIQQAFLMTDALQVFFGGAAGGSKSSALLMAALQFVDVPGYAALILRKTYTDLTLPGALMDRAGEWLNGTDARESKIEHTWHFPGGGSLTFGYAQNIRDVQRYRSAEFQFIGIDESTQHDEAIYRFLFTRLRAADQGLRSVDGLTLRDVPIRMRCASNPGDIGHAWHVERFIDPKTREPDVWYLPSKLEDNPSLDIAEYERALKLQDPVNWRRYRYGDWEVRDPGQVFDRTRIEILDHPWGESREIERCRYWDMASSEVKPGKDPDWCVGTRIALNHTTGDILVEDVVAFRGEPQTLEARVEQTAAFDGRDIPIVIEQEPGSQGKAYIDRLRRTNLRPYRVHGDRATGPKELRIRSLIPVIDSGMCKIVRGGWNQMWLDELDAYPHTTHDDQMDSFAGAHSWVTSPRNRIIL